MSGDKRFIVKFRYYSIYENEKENKDEIIENIVYFRDKEALENYINEDDDYDDSQGINFEAKSDLIDAGRELLSIAEEKE